MKQKFLLVLFAGIISVNALAQPQLRGQKAIGGNDLDQFSSMDLTKDGGLIVGGYSFSDKSFQKTENNKGLAGTGDYWVVKLNSNHKIQWDKTIGGNIDDRLTCVRQTSDGGYILGGFSNSDRSGDKTQESRGDFDYWVVKINKNSGIEWDRTIGGNDDDELESVQQTSDGGYILGGFSYSNISGEKTENNRAEGPFKSPDYWVVKLNGAGEIQWDKTIGGSDEDNLYALQQTTDGGYILGGLSYSNKSGEKTENRRGSSVTPDYWVVKLDSHGNIRWDKTIGGDGDDELLSLQQTVDGGYMLGGISGSDISAQKTEVNRGGDDYWVVKLDQTGNVQWDKTIGGSDIDVLTSLQQTRDSGYILGGWSHSNISYEKSENTRNYAYDDYWVVKLDKDGSFQWDKTVGGTNLDRLQSIKEIGKNRYLLGGYSESRISGDRTVRLRGSRDYWLVKLVYEKTSGPVIAYQNKSEIATPKNGSNNFTIYPNPAKDILYIQIKHKATLSLTDQSGKILLTKTFDGTGTINVAGVKPGLYYLKNNCTSAMKKIIVNR